LKKNDEMLEKLKCNIPEKHSSVIFIFTDDVLTIIKPKNSVYKDELESNFGYYYYVLDKESKFNKRSLRLMKSYFKDDLIKALPEYLDACMSLTERLSKVALVMYRTRQPTISVRVFVLKPGVAL